MLWHVFSPVCSDPTQKKARVTYDSTLWTHFSVLSLFMPNVVVSYHSKSRKSTTSLGGSKSRRLVSFRENEKYLESNVRFCAPNSSFNFESRRLEYFVVVKNYLYPSQVKFQILGFWVGNDLCEILCHFECLKMNLEGRNLTQIRNLTESWDFY